MKQLRMMGDEICVCIATRIAPKEILKKIDAKKKANNLNKMENVWVSLHIHLGVDGLNENDQLMGDIRNRVRRSAWLEGVILFKIFHSSDGTLETRYIVIDA